MKACPQKLIVGALCTIILACFLYVATVGRYLLDYVASSDESSGDALVGHYGRVREGTKIPLLPDETRVLITGAAGFIGMSLADSLGNRGISVVGVDDFNSYYSPPLKRARAAHLQEMHGIDVVVGDVCNRSMMTKFMVDSRVTHIVHLAAQAGVRYSFKHPMTYVERNVQCFVELLEAIVARDADNRPYLIYASSSSAYGLNTKIPFSESDRTDRPSNLYGATKRSNEQVAVAYHNLYGLRSVGCRFFTVYGPWGRPDMAVYKFVDKIAKGQPIPVFNGGAMKRDFTFVGDIVNGLEAAMEWRDAEGAPQVFNLGNHQPVELMSFIHTIEGALDKNATILDAGPSPGEVESTFADIRLAGAALGYVPKTSLRVGIQRFVEWYKSDLRKEEFSSISE
jgi:UDP-glucuronate 4-epimerase